MRDIDCWTRLVYAVGGGVFGGREWLRRVEKDFCKT